MGFPGPRTIGQRTQNAMPEGRIFVARPDARSRKSLTSGRPDWRTVSFTAVAAESAIHGDTAGEGISPVLRVARGLLSELHPGSEAEFAVHVGEVRLHGARRHEEPGGDLLVGKPLGHQAGYVAFGGS